MFNALRIRKFRFRIEEISQKGIRGWIFNRKSSFLPQVIRLYLDGTRVSEFSTDIHRPKLNAEHAIQGNHGFRTQIPLKYFDGRKRRLDFRVLDKGREITLQTLALQEHQERILYKVESCDANGVRGWIYDQEHPSNPLHCRMYVGEQLVDDFLTHIEREDVNKKREIQGLHGFRRLIPQAYFDEKPHSVRLTLVADQELLLETRTIQEGPDAILYKLEELDIFRVKGWAYSKTNPETSLNLKVYCNDQKLLGTATKDSRPDLNREHEVSGNHGFDIHIPLSALQDDQNQISVNLVHNKQEICLGKTIRQQDVTVLKERFNSLESRNSQLQQDLKQEQNKRRDETSSLEQSLEQLRQELHFARQQVQQTQNGYQQLESENKDLREQVQTQKKRMRQLQKSRKILEEKLAQSEKQFDEIEQMLGAVLDE